MGGRPAERCRSDALFLTANAYSSAMSIYNPSGPERGNRPKARARALPDSPTCGLHPGPLCRRHLIMSLDEKAWQAVRSRIERAAAAAKRDPATIRLLAVSKGQSAEAIRAAHARGQRAFGENYVQQALAKADALADLRDIEWHLIGPLQSNKTGAAAQRFAWVETIDRVKIA